MTKKQLKEQLKVLKRIRGLEREQHFKNGGTLVQWRGGTRTITVDRKKRRDKRACRGKVRNV
ncbi:hypothetical protein CMI47_05010 [Candidatus Pacearchaeota archaeon]|nr:hypothetical protein [Candidatus Pacearchaeota archaeon]